MDLGYQVPLNHLLINDYGYDRKINMENPSLLYEQWLASEDKSAFLENLDDMARDSLLTHNQHYYYRVKEYPPIEDFLDAYIKDDAAGLADYKQKCLDVKIKYPKVLP